MKKYFILIAMLVLTTFAMAQQPGKKYSKPYYEAKAVLEEVKTNAQNAKDCDELNASLFGLIALMGVEDLENITKEEDDLLLQISNKIDQVLEKKKATLGCESNDDNDDGD